MFASQFASRFAPFKVDAVTLSGEVPVSVWAQKCLRDGQKHWLITMEQVERMSASISLAQDVIGIFIYFLFFLAFIPQ